MALFRLGEAAATWSNAFTSISIMFSAIFSRSTIPSLVIAMIAFGLIIIHQNKGRCFIELSIAGILAYFFPFKLFIMTVRNVVTFIEDHVQFSILKCIPIFFFYISIHLRLCCLSMYNIAWRCWCRSNVNSDQNGRQRRNDARAFSHVVWIRTESESNMSR